MASNRLHSSCFLFILLVAALTFLTPSTAAAAVDLPNSTAVPPSPSPASEPPSSSPAEPPSLLPSSQSLKSKRAKRSRHAPPPATPSPAPESPQPPQVPASPATPSPQKNPETPPNRDTPATPTSPATASTLSPPPSVQANPATRESPTTRRTPPSPPPIAETTAQQLNKIIDALIGAGDFESWANILNGASPMGLPLSATIFIPQNDAVTRLPTADALLFPYHVVPQRLTFADLRLFALRSRIPTLLPAKTILVTNNSLSNFTLDDAPVTQPDAYVTATVAVHGLGGVLQYSLYGDEHSLTPRQQQQGQNQQQFSPPGLPGMLLPAGQIVPAGIMSGATKPCLCIQFPVGLMVAFAILGCRIHRNYFW